MAGQNVPSIASKFIASGQRGMGLSIVLVENITLPILLIVRQSNSDKSLYEYASEIKTGKPKGLFA